MQGGIERESGGLLWGKKVRRSSLFGGFWRGPAKAQAVVVVVVVVLQH